MMKFAVVFMLVLLLAPGLATAETSKELIENARAFDGGQVTLQGEVIGVMMRGNNAWVNVYEGGYAIGVWVRAEDARNISFIGDYSHAGDNVLVTGTFNMADPEHGGDLDIRAENFTITAQGAAILRTPNVIVVAISMILVALAIVSLVWLWRIHKGEEKIAPWPVYWR